MYIVSNITLLEFTLHFAILQRCEHSKHKLYIHFDYIERNLIAFVENEICYFVIERAYFNNQNLITFFALEKKTNTPYV